MTSQTDVVVLYTTFENMAAAKNCGRTLVEERLAACVNILPDMVSVYRWEGEVEQADEAVMIVKTTRVRMDEVIHRIVQLHDYETPAIVALPVIGGGAHYLNWIAAETV